MVNLAMSMPMIFSRWIVEQLMLYSAMMSGIVWYYYIYQFTLRLIRLSDLIFNLEAAESLVLFLLFFGIFSGLGTQLDLGKFNKYIHTCQ